MTRVDSTNVLIATDELHSFVGKLVFDGPDWLWTGWSYQIRFVSGVLNGSTVEGAATLDASGMSITKKSHSQYGEMLIRESEKPISQAQYEACRSKFLSTTSSKENCQF